MVKFADMTKEAAMTETKHTKEPWSVNPKAATAVQATRSDGIVYTVASCGTFSSNKDDSIHEEQKANATRVAACVSNCKGLNPEAVPN